MTAGGAWVVERTVGPAGPQHERPVPDPARRAAWIHEVDRPTVVLGSGQRREVVDLGRARAAGVDVVRRRSGGGAVLLEPGRSAWVDLLVPAGDPCWDDDVVRAAAWVGALWRELLGVWGWRGEVHEGRLEPGRWGALVCFAGTGPGEVLVDGRKVVGVSQRRTRRAARFQCLVDPVGELGPLLDLLDLDPAERAAARDDLAEAARPLPRLDLLLEALPAHLPR